MAKKSDAAPAAKKTNIKPRAQTVKPVEAEEEKVSETTEESGATEETGTDENQPTGDASDTDKSGDDEAGDKDGDQSGEEEGDASGDADKPEETERLLEGANGERLRESIKQLDEGGGTERELLDGANEHGIGTDTDGEAIPDHVPPAILGEPEHGGVLDEHVILPDEESASGPSRIIHDRDAHALVVKRRPRR